MDFNSIFGRSSSGAAEGLEKRMEDEDTVYAYWADYIDEVALFGRTESSVKIAERLHRNATARLEYDNDHLLSDKGLDKQSHMLDRHQTLALIAELEAFVRSRAPLPSPQKKSKTAKILGAFLDENVRETYNVLIHSFFQGIYEAEQTLYHVGAMPKSLHVKGQQMALKHATERVATLYDQFNNDFPRARARYEALKADVKSKIPPRLHYLIDKVVELFVYDPYEIGILYVRRHHPGMIGAFHGLEEGDDP